MAAHMVKNNVDKTVQVLGGGDGLDLLHLCFDHCIESGPVVVFDKTAIFLQFFADALFFLLTYCMFRYSCNKIFWGPWKFLWKWSKMLVVVDNIFKTLVGKEIIMWNIDWITCCTAWRLWILGGLIGRILVFLFITFACFPIILWLFDFGVCSTQVLWCSATRGLWPREVCSSHALHIQGTVCDSDRVRYSATSAACTRPPHRERSDISVKRQY